MDDGRQIYVLDTNILVDYPDIIPSNGSANPDEPTIDLSGGHIVIPSAVIRELSSFKSEKTERGKAARIVLKRLRELVEDKTPLLKKSYLLEEPIEIPGTDQLLSIFPISKTFKKTLPFQPSEEDMDGQIILAAVAIADCLNGEYSLTGEEKQVEFKDWMKYERNSTKRVMILTNDNGLAIRAHERGIRTSRYGYKYPEPYTGRRDLKVPKELFSKLYLEREVPRAEFERLMPEERKLVANEFIIMTPENPDECPYYSPGYDSYYSNVGRYDIARDAIVPLKFVRSFPVKPQSLGQALYMEALASPSISAVICTGPAGSGKTYIATIFGYLACLGGQFIGVAVVPCENHSKIGALPGDLTDKMDPQVQPLKNAIRNYLLNEDVSFKRRIINLQKYGDQSPEVEDETEEVSECCSASSESETPEECKDSKGRSRRRKSKNGKKKTYSPKAKSVKQLVDEQVNLIWRNWFSVVPIENARGQDFAYQLAIYDEFQDQNVSQADTLIKRIGAEGKIILTGDVGQIHAPYLDETNNGIVYASGVLYDDPMVAQVHFTEEDVVRHPLVKLIAERQKQAKSQKEDI